MSGPPALGAYRTGDVDGHVRQAIAGRIVDLIVRRMVAARLDSILVGTARQRNLLAVARDLRRLADELDPPERTEMAA